MKKLHLKTCVLTACVVLASMAAGAQKVITFESHDSKKGHNKAFTSGEGQNSVTVGLLSWFNGYVPVYYERAVFSMFSLQVGGGLTVRSFGNDLGYALASEGATSSHFNSAIDGFDIVDDYSHYKYRQTLPGLYASFAPKVYYHDEGMDGEYVSPMVEYKMFRYSAKKADETVTAVGAEGDDRLIPHSSEAQAEYMRCIDFTVNFGGQYQSRNHVTFGWSTGIGIRNSSSERLDIGVVRDALGNQRYANAVEEYSKTKLLVTFNFIVGGWF